MAQRDLLVRVIGDSRSVEQAFARSSRSAQQFGASVDTTAKKADRGLRSVKGFAAGSAAGFGGAIVLNEVTQQIRAAITVASNLQEQTSKTNVIFGESAGVIRKWAQTTAESMGIARDQALAAASTFGSMFDAAGQSAGRSAELSKSVVALAADLASFNNTSVEESLTALRSGLSGEIEPLRRFQVFLTEASVAQEAMARSGKTNARELTQGEKIMARYALILRKTGNQQGDFARTSGGLANQQRILSAQTRDLQANVGTLLLPAITELVENLNKATTGALALGDALTVIGNVNIPVIDIPIKVALTGDLPGVGGTLPGEVGKHLLPPQLRGALPFVKAIQDALRPERVPDVNAAAESFVKDTGISAFIENLPKKVQKIIKGAASFGDKGFKPVENELAETLQRQFDDLVDALTLNVDKAKATSGTGDDLAALAKIETAIRNRMKTEGRTTDLLRALFQVSQDRQAVLDGIKEQNAKNRQAGFDKILGGLQVAVGRAEQTTPLKDDIKALQNLAGGLREQIKAGVDVESAQSQLVEVTDLIAATVKQARVDSFAKILGALESKVSKAELTPILKDDVARLNELADGLRRQIKAGVDVQSAQEQLVGVTGQIAAKQQEIQRRTTDALKAKTQARQFRSLGLSKTGDEIIPGVKNLQTRVTGALSRIQSGDLDVGSKVADRLKLARNLIRKEGKNLTEETRGIINDLLKTLNDGQDKLAKPLTAGRKLSTAKLLEGLGLPADVARELRGRLSQISPGGTVATGGLSAAGQVITGGTSTAGMTINGPITVVADNPDAFMRELQKRQGRTAASTRGRYAGRGVGLG